MDGLRKVPVFVWLAIVLFALLLWAFVSLLQSKAQRELEATALGEFVSQRDISGHAYSLFFHRARPHFNSIEKDGRRVFDSRDVAGAEGCVWELLVQEGKPTARCYRAGGEPELLHVELP